jgi:uncharacterized protein (DUF2147 family)
MTIVIILTGDGTTMLVGPPPISIIRTFPELAEAWRNSRVAGTSRANLCTTALNNFMKRLMISLLALLVMARATAGSIASGDEILGIWKTYDNRGNLESSVEIYKEKDKYCAKIVSLTEPNWPAGDDQNMAGKAKSDRHNPNVDLRSRPIIGMQIMQDFIYNAGKKIWEGGRIYDPGNGKTYKCKFTLTSPNQLEVRGYIGISLLGRTEIWTR